MMRVRFALLAAVVASAASAAPSAARTDATAANRAPRIGNLSLRLLGSPGDRRLEVRLRVCDDSVGRRGRLELSHQEDAGGEDALSFGAWQERVLAFPRAGCWRYAGARPVPRRGFGEFGAGDGCYIVRVTVRDPSGRRSNALVRPAKCPAAE